ncbi:DNA invertase Pin-like site-specific DNA recombinase [Actinomadura pelletieri DSM 43383]|uniref:DNA invertase Pin-like site-specific DNA recombinase n=2 Tax=Actinomadura pelletieri TaxID=111805 RepID=A0A495QA17_9ACTN|nr:DNA invertase Pin-like site-specific DNA recombinase [Actinomadura pelletieri DSM 43383]
MVDQTRSPIPLDVFTQGTHSSRSAGLTGPGGGVRSDGPLRVAFAGRTSTEDKQDPTLSLPRQLANSQTALHTALPGRAVIVAHFYDIESGRKDLAARGFGRGHERFTIPIPRDGGIQDLLLEAAQADRRFDAVICESVDRIARRTYVGTQIENTLEKLGIPLWASDEPIALNGKRSSQVLTRRVKQGVAEWYVLEMLEKAWGGFEVHTEQGFNVGRPPYGYLAQKVPHPVAARREQGATKHVLAPDPVRGPVVATVFEIRAGERLGYQAIADRLNRDLDRYPPPVATAKHRSVGRWTYSSVREVLTNPKYTGYMVWNRKATTSARGRNNPPEAWVWSSAPTHPALVSVETFTDAQKVARDREGSRSRPGPNTAQTGARRSYALRSYMVCGLCGRRMFGKESRGRIYYICRPARAYRPEGHPASIWVREEPLMAGLTEFFNREIFGPHRRERLHVLLARLDDSHLHEHRERLAAVEGQIVELKRRKERVLDSLEAADEPSPAFVNSINERTTRIGAELEGKQAVLRELREAVPVAPCPELLDRCPTGTVDLGLLPEVTLRRLLDAFAVQMRHDPEGDLVAVQVTITPETADTQLRAAHAAIAGDGDGADGDHAAVRVVPPTGFEPALPP